MNEKIYTVFLAFFIICMTICLILFPEASFHASLRGLDTWWKVVFPSLLPFFVMAELLIRFGVVQFIGVLFEPVMRPVFRVSGIGSFAWIVGMASGYPAGAKITALLRQKEQITRIEAERLVAFSNASSPLFIFGAIAVGFFHQPELGILIAVSHYSGNILVGICMRFYQKEPAGQAPKMQDESMMRRAFQKMHRTRLQKQEPLGKIIGDSVLASVQTLLMIGGFIIFFSVFTSMLQVIHVAVLLEWALQPVAAFLPITGDMISAMFTGLFEITVGAESVTQITDVSIRAQLVLISILLGFNGLSIQAQVASLLAQTDIRFTPYFFSRILHAIFASVLCYVLYPILYKDSLSQGTSTPVFSEKAEGVFQGIIGFGPLLTITSILLSCIILYFQARPNTMK